MLCQILSYLVQIKSNLFCIVLTLHYLCIEILTNVIMKNFLLTMIFVMGCAMGVSAQELPHMQQSKAGKTQLIVDGKPFIALAGELHNSTTGSVENMRGLWKRMADKNLNTVVAPISWELLEPEEGKFDYTLLDAMITGAREQNLKLVVLWFGSWKNGTSTYAPLWVKTNPKRFPLVKNAKGDDTNTLSTLGAETLKGDANAFAHMMKRIKEVDKDHTVIMIQVENEIGTLDMAASYMGGANTMRRDYNQLAEKAYKGQVPETLTAYLKQHQKELHPAILNAWNANGNKMKGTWEEVFGKSQEDKNGGMESYSYLTEEIFMAWNYASFVGQVASAGKSELALPMYVNAWMKQPKQTEPGFYPSGGPLAHLIDIWRAGAPSIDFIAPDIYATEIFDWICEGYTRSGNPLFIPETRVDAGGAARTFYAIGKYGALCYSPFGIDGGGLTLSADPNEKLIDQVYGTLDMLMPYLQEHIGTGKMAGFFLEGDKKTDTVEMGAYKVSLGKFNTSASMAMFGVATDDAAVTELPTGALVIQTASDEFIVAGGIGSMSLSISKGNGSKAKHVAYAQVDEIRRDADGKIYTHRLNGDETAFGGATVQQGQCKAFRIKMYEY